MAGDRMIRFLCTSPAHRRSTELGLTRHEGQWALCPDLLSQGHEWLDTGGLEVADAVVRWKEIVGLERARPAA
ncbi:MAG: hypothetical protein KGN00_04945 [Chloroflexota bacterium]|nr:hypothetical protein [Chloroflexota bacterium]MDE3193015.1 hypothetical protein [Chloroflexota bacterium]